MNILMVTSEAVPYAKSGGLADAVSALSSELARAGHEVRVVLPRYYFVDRSLLSVIGEPLGVPLGEHELWCAVYCARHPGGANPGSLHYYFLDHEELYGRDGIYGTSSEPFFRDNARRFAFLGRGALQLCLMLGWTPDVVHSHDWPAALSITYLKSSVCPSRLENAAAVFTIHNMGYQGIFELSDATHLGLPSADLARSGIERYGRLNFLKAAIEGADKITTVSPGYAEEIKTAELGFGLEKEVAGRADDLVGIVNGIDYEVWNPETDPLIPRHYSADSLIGKKENKKALTVEAGLRYSDSVPIVGMVSRLVEQKGFADLCGPESSALHAICADLDVQVVILGTGEAWCETELRRLDASLLSLRAFIAFDNRLAHLIEAGADFFLMPSRYEPCGLNQLYSLRYGTIPIVTATGGLRDTIEPYDPETGSGTGFFVDGFGGRAIYRAVERAVELFRRRPDRIDAMRQRGMSRRFSWEVSAEEYQRVYEAASEQAPRRTGLG